MLSIAVLGCRSDVAPTEATEGTATGAATAEDATADPTSIGSSDRGDDADDTGTSNSASDASTGASTTGEPVAACGDGIVSAGELCYPRIVSAGLVDEPLALAAGDLDGNGRPDLAVGYSGQRADVFWNDRSGLGKPTTLDLTAGPEELVVADTTGSGSMDLVFTLSSFSAESFLQRAHHDGTELSLGPVMDLPDPGTALGLAIADLDGDALPDAVVSAWGNNGLLRVLLGDGQGGFSASDAYPVGQKPRRLELADLDGDGAVEILVVLENCFGLFDDPTAYCEHGVLAVLPGNGDGTFGSVIPYDLGIYRPEQPLVGDIDEDGALDVIVAIEDCYPETVGGPGGLGCELPGRIVLLRGDGQGGLGDPEYLVSDPYVRAGQLADLDADGMLDVVVVGHTQIEEPELAADVRILINQGDGVFSEPIRFGPIGDTPFDVVVADFNADGAPDIAVPSYLTRELFLLFSDP